MRKLLAIFCLSALMLATGAFGLLPRVASAATTPGPTEPGAITVSQVTSTSVYLAWNGSTDSLGIEGYRVYRQLAGGPVEQIATTDALRYYTATDLRSGATYQFGVTAIDVANAESPMQTTTTTTLAGTDTTTPLPPDNASLSIKAFSSTRLDVVWGSSPSANVAYFEVYRNGVEIATVDLPNAPRYSDNGLTPSTAYSYTVDAVSSSGLRSAQTVAKSGTTLATGAVIIPRGPVVSNVTGTAAVISWWTNIPTPGVLSVAGQSLTDTAGTVQHHQVAVSGLAAATTYPYTVSSGATSASGSVTTAALPGQTFSFAAMGDYGGGGPGEVNNAANIGKAGTQFIQTLGDNIYPSAGLPDPDFTTTYSDFDTHFYKELGPDVKNQAFFPANGNKDYYSNGQFWVNFPMLGTNHEWYSYNWGDAHILVLDSEQPMDPGSAQFAFAQNDLATNQGEKWRMVAVQRPPYSSTTDNSSSKFALALVPLFQAYRVNLVLSGNSHNYERSYPLTNGVEDTTNGTTYIVSGGGGSGFDKFTSAYPEPAWSAFRESDYWEFAKITVSPTSIQENAIRADTDTVFDSTTITALPPDTTAPSTPTGLVAGDLTASAVPLSWTPNPVADGATGYDIYRTGVKIGSTSGTATSFTDTTAAAGSTYEYTITAVDGAGNISAHSASITVKTPSASQPVLVQTAGSSTTTVSLAAPSTAGDLLVLSASVFTGGSQEITTVTDAAGNTWHKVGAYTVGGQNADGELWYAVDAAPVSQVTVATGATTVALRLQEFSGVATATLDGSIGAAATGTAAASGTVTPTAPNDLAVGFIAGHSNTQAISVTSPGYSVEPLQTTTSPSKVTLQSGYKVLTSAAAQSFAGTFPAAMYWSAGIALFKLGSSAPPTSSFTLAAAPAAGSVAAGSTATATINTAISSGAAESVTLSATGAPTGATVSFSPQPINSGQSSTMSITTSSSTPAGTYAITVTGTGTSTATSTYSLTVTAVTASTPSLVQTAGGTETAAATTITATFPAATRTGDLLVLSAGEDVGATNHITTVTDSAGNLWQPILADDVSGHSSEGELWYSADAFPATTVTVQTSSAASMAIEIEEFAGLATSSPLDVSAGAANTGTTAGSGNATSSEAGELAVGFVAGHANKQVVTVTSPGYTAQPQQTSIGATAGADASVVTGYQLLGAPGAQAIAGSFTGPMYWAAGIAVFKPAG